MSVAVQTDPSLNPCPHCGAAGNISRAENTVIITCSKRGCRSVEARTFDDARKMWNEPRKSL